MPKKDPRVDVYIAKSADFAKPILNHLRKLVHTACPEVEETFKWSFPCFMHKGMLCSMAAFKQHCSFGLWKAALVFAPGEAPASEAAMGQFGRLTQLSDLPKDSVLLGYLKKAVQLNEAGIKKPAAPRPKVKKELVVPDFLTNTLVKHQKARAMFDGFSYSHKKEYVQWLTEAKTAETRERRLATAIAWLTEGKSRHWKYANC
jgi:uncharacterized protein YdeI (YjbR/CyaY-like superfamily)